MQIDKRWDFNVFDETWAWGYQIPEIYDDKICTYPVRTANEYRATNGNFSVDTCVEHLPEHRL